MKTLIRIAVFLILFLKIASPVIAQEKIAGSSAVPNTVEADKQAAIVREQNRKKEAIRRVLKQRNSPLVEHVDDFIDTCTKHNIDCYLLPAITGLESSFGQYTHPGSYNPFGWGGGYILFDDWGEAIATVGAGLRENYINRGATSIEAIGRIYAASPTWAVRVNYFMAVFEAEEKKSELNSVGGTIQL